MSKKIKVAVVRGRYLNNFEMQNYDFRETDISITGFSSQQSLHDTFKFPVIALPSFADLQFSNFLDKPIKVLANRLLGDSQILYGLEKYASEFDIFHTADPHYYYSYQLAKLRAENKIKKLIVTSWETIPFNNESVAKKKYIKNFTLKHADEFICYTDKAKECLIMEGVSSSKIEVIKLGVKLDKFKNEKLKIKNENSRPENINILYVGRLVEEKGVMDLLEAFRYVKLETSNFKRNICLKIIGNGKLSNELKKKIWQYELQRFVSMQQKSYEDMPEVYQQADIFVMPSKRTKTWEEQYGMVLVEAMAGGLPIIAYESGAVPEVLGDTGILVKEGDMHELSKQIKLLIDNETLRNKLAALARLRAEKYFNSEKTAMSLKRIYQTT